MIQATLRELLAATGQFCVPLKQLKAPSEEQGKANHKVIVYYYYFLENLKIWVISTFCRGKQ